MRPPTPSAKFTLADLQQSASDILNDNPDAVVAWRLINEVLRLPLDAPQHAEAKSKLASSRWVQQLEQAQLLDGSFGRFHTQDTKQKTTFRTTEEAIDRAFALGLEPQQQPLTGVRHFIQQVYCGEAIITDRDEKNEAWPLGIKLILAGRLAQLDPANDLLPFYWIFLSEVAGQAFCSGNYRLDDEVAAIFRLSGVHWPQGFLESQHALWLLSSHKLPENLEYALVRWVYHKPDGIRYLRAPLSNSSSRNLGYWLRSMNLISRFTSWREICTDTLNHLWEQRGKDGLWDFGSENARSIDFPLSESWRNVNNRRMDYSTAILALLRKVFDVP